jgi:hypothetical protein
VSTLLILSSARVIGLSSRELCIDRSHPLPCPSLPAPLSRNRYTPRVQAEVIETVLASFDDQTQTFKCPKKSAFLIGTGSLLQSDYGDPDFKLSDAQHNLLGQGVTVDVKGKGKGREMDVEMDLDNRELVQRRRCEKGFERGEVMYRCRSVFSFQRPICHQPEHLLTFFLIHRIS